MSPVGTPPYVFPPFGNINKDWVLYADGRFAPAGGGMGGNEQLLIVDMSAGDQVVTLGDPAGLPDGYVLNVKVWRGGVHELHIAPGIAGTIDELADGIRTRTNQQGYRLTLASNSDPALTGWACIETAYGGEPAAANVGDIIPPIGVVPCDSTEWITGERIALLAEYIEEITADGPWSKPVGSYAFGAFLGYGGGGGGGGAMTLGSGDDGNPGTGGGGGARKLQIYNYSDIPATVTVAIGQGGAGAPAKDRGESPEDGSPGTATTVGAIFSAGAGGGGGKASRIGGAGGGGWDGDGATVGATSPCAVGGSPQVSATCNANGAECGAGGTGVSSTKNQSEAAPKGCAESGGGAGGGGKDDASGTNGNAGGHGGSSRYGGGGGGTGGFNLGGGTGEYGNNQSGSDGGRGSTYPVDPINGGGGRGGIFSHAGGANSGLPGADGSGYRAGNGGGGGGGYQDPVGSPSGANHGGDGGDGGFPAGGGGGSSSFYANGNPPERTGKGGDGANGRLWFFAW